MTYASWDLLFEKINYYLVPPIFMPKSLRLSGKFNAEEAEIIERIMKKYNLNANQFVKKSVTFALAYAEYENWFLTDPELKKMMKIIRDEYEKIMSNPRNVKRVEKMLGARKISQEGLDKLESRAIDIEKEIKKLRKKKKPGRPKVKKKRGRPKR